MRVNEMRRVAVALSGGVDSTAAAVLLKSSGYSLIGVFMKNWDEWDEAGQCSADRDYHRVRQVCEALDIPCTQVNFVKEYWNDVFSHFIQAYQQGHTPNPDVLCNRHIKFSALHHYCLETLQVDAIATGHYARVQLTENGAKLLKAIDSCKDQTYFLSQVSQSSLRKTLFPVGDLVKRRVREIAREAGFSHVAQQKESMGVCFIGKRHFPSFLSQYVEDKPGRFLTLSGEVLGSHNGHHLFTVGQRARIGGQPRPWFVAGKDPTANTVSLAEGSNHPALYTTSLTTAHPHWISHDPLLRGAPLQCELRHRHQGPLVQCTVEQAENGEWSCASVRYELLHRDSMQCSIEETSVWVELVSRQQGHHYGNRQTRRLNSTSNNFNLSKARSQLMIDDHSDKINND